MSFSASAYTSAWAIAQLACYIITDDSTVRFILHNATPYSAIRSTEFKIVPDHLLQLPSLIEPKPVNFKFYDFWQHGNGDYASARQRIIGSVPLMLHSNTGT